jgi:hypothetical protein
MQTKSREAEVYATFHPLNLVFPADLVDADQAT